MSRSISDLERSRCMRMAMERFRMPCKSMPSSAAAPRAHRQSCGCHTLLSCWRMTLLRSASAGLPGRRPALQQCGEVRNTVMLSRAQLASSCLCMNARHGIS